MLAILGTMLPSRFEESFLPSDCSLLLLVSPASEREGEREREMRKILFADMVFSLPCWRDSICLTLVPPFGFKGKRLHCWKYLFFSQEA